MQAYCISPNQQVFRKYSKFCSLVTKCFLGSDEMASPAGFVSWTIVWRPWLSALKCSVKSLKSMRGWQAMLHQRAVDIPAFIKKKTISSEQDTNLSMTRPLLRHSILLYIRKHLYYSMPEPSRKCLKLSTVKSTRHNTIFLFL